MSRLTVPPLTAEEARWIKQLQRVLAACPDRLELYTIGDRHLTIVDREGAKGDLHNGAADRRGIVLGVVSGPTVHGVSG